MKNNDMTKSTRHKPQSRINYEQRNPVFSVRMPQELHDALTLFLKKTNRSRKTFIEIALNQLEASHKQASKQGYDEGHAVGYDKGKKEAKILGAVEGYEKGRAEGKEEWGIWVKCYSCGEPVYIIPGSEMHEYIREMLKMMGREIRHPTCHP